jgi:hypothetical protein
MGTLSLTLPDGRSGTVNVDDSFAHLSPAQQESTIGEIQSSLGSHSSFTDDLKAGTSGAMNAVGNLVQGAGSVANDLGATNVGSALTGAGNFVKQHAPSVPAGYHNQGEDILQDLGQGQFMKAAGGVAHAVVAGAPTLGATLAAGALGGPIAGAAVAGGLAEGEAAGRRAQAAGRSAPSSADMAGALPNAAVNAGLATLPAGKLLGGSAARRMAGAALMGGGQSAANQYDATGSIDPTQVGNAAITGAATGGAGELAGGARGAVKAGVDNAMSRAYSPASDAQAQSWQRVSNDVAQRQQATPGVDAFAVTNNLKQEYLAKAQNFVNDAKAAGADKSDIRDLSLLVNNQGLRHNNTISEDPASLYGAIDNMGLPLPADRVAAFKQDVMDLDTISRQSFKNAGTGPFQKAGQIVGKGASIIGGAMSGNPVEMMAGMMGHGLAGKLGGHVGSMVDRAFGTNTPALPLQGMAANRYLEQRGLTSDRVQPAPWELPAPAERPTPTPGFIRPNASNTINPPAEAEPSTPTPGFIRPQVEAPQGPRPTPTPGFIRPQVEVPQGPRPTPTPGFIRPQIEAPQGPRPTPTPGFIRPQVQAPQGPAPTPTPGFMRPNASNTIQAAPSPEAPEAPTPAPNPLQGLMAAKRLAAARAALGPTTDAVGNPVDAIPVNTRIKNNGRAALPQQQAPSNGSGLVPNTPAQVREQIAQDDGIPKMPSGPLPGQKYLMGGIPGVTTPEAALKVAQAAEAAGAVPHGTSDLIATAQGNVAKQLLEAIKSHAISGQMSQVGRDPISGGTKGASEVRNPYAYQQTLRQEQNAYEGVPQDLQALANAMRNPQANGKTKAGRRAVLEQAKALMDQAAAIRAEQHLGPLTGYGQ